MYFTPKFKFRVIIGKFGTCLIVVTVIHDMTAVAKNTRRALFPWFVRLKEDSQTLECKEASSWDDLVCCIGSYAVHH